MISGVFRSKFSHQSIEVCSPPSTHDNAHDDPKTINHKRSWTSSNEPLVWDARPWLYMTMVLAQKYSEDMSNINMSGAYRPPVISNSGAYRAISQIFGGWDPQRNQYGTHCSQMTQVFLLKMKHIDWLDPQSQYSRILLIGWSLICFKKTAIWNKKSFQSHPCTILLLLYTISLHLDFTPTISHSTFPFQKAVSRLPLFAS